MNFFLQSAEYLCGLKDKGWYDEGFYNEFDFICHETYDFKALEKSDTIQEDYILSRE